MAAKLEYDVSVKTDEAKRKLRQDLSTVEVGGKPSSPSTAAADKAARSLNSLASSAEKTAPSLDRAIKAFAGMGISMAASYAANALPEDSMARKVVDYGGNIIGGAVSGMALGPWGALIGAVVGGAKTYLDDSGKESAALLDFRASEARHAEAVGWKDRLKSLTDLGDSPSSDIVEAKLAEVRDALEQKKQAEAKLVEDIKKYIENGEYYSANYARQSLGVNRQHQDQLQNAETHMDAELDRLRELEMRQSAPSLAAADALSRIGGSFGNGDLQADALRALTGCADETNRTLGRIERKMQKGGTF